MKEKKPIVAVLFHNYYGDDTEWIRFFTSEINLPFHLLYHGVSGTYYRLQQPSVPAALPTGNLQQLLYRASPNKGKDIGGKLVLLDTYLRLNLQSDYMLFLHDKRSPYHHQGAAWKKKLFRIAEKENLPAILSLFENERVGMVAAENNIRNEMDNELGRNAYIDTSMIIGLKEKYGIHPPGLQFVAGTMFWVRTTVFTKFFSQHAPLAIRATLEAGNVTDGIPTLTHAWERLLSWIVTGGGYQIKGF